MKRLAIVVVALGLAGCETAEITTPPVNVSSKISGASGVDVYAGQRARGNPVPRFRGQDIIQVRTRANVDGSNTEITGASCTLDSGIFSATFQSPANVVVPDYGPNGPAVFVRCTANDLSASRTVAVFNATSRQRQSAGAGGGILGALVAGAIDAARTNTETDDFDYPSVTLRLEPPSETSEL